MNTSKAESFYVCIFERRDEKLTFYLEIFFDLFYANGEHGMQSRPSHLSYFPLPSSKAVL